MIIRVSDLSAYSYCKRKFFLERILHIVEIPRDVLIKGSLRHEWHDKANKIEESIVTSVTQKLPLSKLEDLYKRNYSTILRELVIKYKPQLRQVNIPLIDMFRQTWPVLLSESKSRAKNIHNFIIKENTFGKELWDLLTPKIHTEFKVESVKLGLKGIVDRVDLYDNKYVPYEIKTGKTPESGLWPSHKIQIAAYMLLLQEQFNSEVKLGYVCYVDSNEDRAISMNPFLKEDVLTIKKEVCSLLEGKELPDFESNENKCKNCSIRESCNNSSFIDNKLKILKTNQKI